MAVSLDASYAHLKGELAALLAAFFWAIAATIYARTGARIPVLELNVLKGIVAIGLLLLTLAIAPIPLAQPPIMSVGLLLASGTIGIGIGDTAFLSALKTLGSRRTLLFETLAPPLTAVLGTIFLGERLPAGAWGAIALTLSGIFWVIGERTPAEASVPRDRTVSGLGWAALAAAAQAGGAILSRAALRDSDIDPLWSALLRLVAGTLCALLLLGARRQSLTLLGISCEARRWRTLGTVALAALLGTYLGIWLQQTSFKFASAGIAQTLSATSPLFVLPLAAASGERIGWRAILGAAVALTGVAWLFLAA